MKRLPNNLRLVSQHPRRTCVAVSDSPPTGFSLVELLVVVFIIAMMVAVLLPTLAKARESSLRVQCASNLRQCGMAELMYSNENRGWLFLRETSHAGSISSLVSVNGGAMSVSVTRYAPVETWFCPEYTDVNTNYAQLASLSRKKGLMGLHRPGYGFFGASWNGGAISASGPNNGAALKFTNPSAMKQSHLAPNLVRMTEWYAASGSAWQPNGESKWHTGVRNRGPEGGNILFGDGHVQWSKFIFSYYGGEHYTGSDTN